eukprot:6462473-Amphidinium_carterae.1
MPLLLKLAWCQKGPSGAVRFGGHQALVRQLTSCTDPAAQEDMDGDDSCIITFPSACPSHKNGCCTELKSLEESLMKYYHS